MTDTTAIINNPLRTISKEYREMLGRAGCDPMTRAEETATFADWHNGDEGALDRIISANLRFALQYANAAVGRGLPLEDLICAANTGLLLAAQKFDPEKGYKFISYAVCWVRQQINKEITDHKRTIRLNNMADKLVQRQTKIRWELSQQLGRLPRRHEVAEAYKAKYGPLPQHWDDVQAMYADSPSLDQILYDDGDPLSGHGFLCDEHAPDPSEEAYASERASAIREVLSGLPEREADFVVLYFGLLGNQPHTLDEIGAMYGLTRERVRQVRNNALDRLREDCPQLAEFAPV